MSSELTYVVVKPCGLTIAVGAQKEFTVGHDDKMTQLPNSIARADVASLCAYDPPRIHRMMRQEAKRPSYTRADSSCC